MQLWQKKLGKDAFRPWIDTLVSDNGMEVLCNRLAQPVRGLDFSSEKCGSETSHLFFPDYHQAPWEKYLVPYPIIPIHTSYGCYWGRCQYCPEALQDNVHEVISENKLSQIIEAIARPHSSGMIHFTDNALPPTILDFLCKHAALLPWFGFARISPELGKKAYVEQLRRSGCRMLQMGLESGSRSILGRLRKGISLVDASNALKHLKKAGIGVYLYVMFGIPGETETEAQETLNFVADHADCISFMNVSLLNLPIEWPEENDLKRRAFEGGPAYDLALYTGFDAEGGWQRKEARHFIERVFRKHPAIAPILRRTPMTFGPSHAACLLQEGGNHYA